MTSDGNAVIGGEDRAWVAKRTLGGEAELFRVQLGSDSRDVVNALASGADGKLYAAGAMFINGVERSFLATLDSNGKRISLTTLPTAASALAVDVAGRVYVAGRKPSTVETGNYGDDAYVAKLDAGQTRWEWVLPFGGTGAVEEARAIAFDAQGSLYVAGVTNSVDFPVKSAYQDRLNGPQDAFLVKVLPDVGHVEWATYLGGPGTESVAAMLVDGNGDILVAGSTNSRGIEEDFLARFDTNGKLFGSDYLPSVADSSRIEILSRAAARPRPAARMAGTTSSSTVLAATPNPSFLGAPITLTATVTAGATGQVTFYDGTTVLGIATLSANKATITTIMLPFGARSLRAFYAGDATYNVSNSTAVAQSVAAKPARDFSIFANFGTACCPQSVTVADFNGDGKADLVTANELGNSVSVMLGNGNGTFQPAVTYAVGIGLYTVVAADFNGDGKPDIVTANITSGDVSILLGNGNGTFQPAVNYSFANGLYSLAVGDFNGDGKADLVTVNSGSKSISIILGNGNGTFQSPVHYIVGNGPMSVALGDFNGDGKTDLAVVNAFGNSLSILIGNGDGTFQPAVAYGAGATPVSVAVGDFNGDGKADLVLVDDIFGGSVNVLLGNGNGTFQAAIKYSGVTYGQAVVVGDFNGDGKTDIAAVELNSSVRVFLGNGNGTFAAPLSFKVDGTVGSSSGLAVGDFNGDGRSDLVTANHDSSTVSVLLGLPAGRDKVGGYKAGFWNQDWNGDFVWQGTSLDRVIFWSFGQAGEMPVSGDWNGDGGTKTGVIANGIWYLDYNGNGVWDGPSVDKSFFWSTGQAGEVPVLGDWNGDGRIKAGVYNNGTWILDYNGNGVWDGPSVDKIFFWSTGLAGEVPIVGDWNGDHKTKVGVFVNGVWVLDYNGNNIWDGPGVDKSIFWSTALSGEVPVTGDWNGDGKTKIAIYRNGTWIVDYNGNYAWDGSTIDKFTFFGGPDYAPIVGDWDGSGTSKIGAYANAIWELDVNGNFVWDPPTDRVFYFFTATGQKPIVGKW